MQSYMGSKLIPYVKPQDGVPCHILPSKSHAMGHQHVDVTDEGPVVDQLNKIDEKIVVIKMYAAIN